MKHTIHFLLVCLFTLTFLQICAGQEKRSWMNPIGALSDADQESFSSLQAGFSVRLPMRTGGFNGTTGMSYRWRLNEGYFIAGTLERAEEIEGKVAFQPESEAVIQNVFSQFQADLFAAPLKPSKVEWKSIKVGGHSGLEARISMPKGLSVIRVFWIKQKAYQIGVMLFEDQLKFEPQALRVLDTLKVISPANIEAVALQKVEAATPAPLPQTPVAPKLKSDAEDEKLKGKVKFVLRESRYIKGPKANTPKQKDSEDFFNESGNFTKRISYDNTTGFPFQIRVYGYLDGNRVEKAGFVHLDEALVLRAPMMPSKPRDNRYSLRFDYQYDADGRLKEYTVFGNDGSVSTKTVFTYRETEIESITYQNQGKFSTRSIDKLDAKGQISEAIYFGFGNADWQEKSVYSYDELDKQGNWTKRTTTFYRKKNGAAVEEWVSETYREIIYY